MSESSKAGEETGSVSNQGESAPTVLYEKVGDRIARVTLNRPEVANAQNYEMLYALNRWIFARECFFPAGDDGS